jgi:uncharacterized circularly permuted ATP-grasp superfamily protein
MQRATACYDEMLDDQGGVRGAYAGYRAWYDAQDPAALRRKGQEAEGFFRKTGITFNVYGDDPVRHGPQDRDRQRMAQAVARD